MNAPTPVPGDLTPTEELIIEVLTARARLGETLWPFNTNTMAAARRLEDRGLISLTHGMVERTYRASLTDAGKTHALNDHYVPPVLRPDCDAVYVGDLSGWYRIECDRPNHHDGLHRSVSVFAMLGPGGPAAMVKPTKKQARKSKEQPFGKAGVIRWSNEDTERAVAAYLARRTRP